MSDVDCFLSKIIISELGTYFDDISFFHCREITSEEEYQCSIEDFLVDLLQGDCDYRVTFLMNFNPEIFNLNERVVVHDNIFELRTVIGSKNGTIINGVGIS